MSRALSLAVLLLLVLAAPLAHPVMAALPDLHVGGLWKAADTDQEYVAGEIKIRFRDDVTVERRAAIHRENGVRVLADTPHYTRITVPDGVSVPEFAARYAKLPEVEWSVPNYLAHINLVPNDPNYATLQWDLPNIGMEQAWDLATGAGIKVSLNDTGIAYENFGSFCKAPDFAGITFDTADAYDFINNDPHPNDDNGHGTHTCGTLAETTNNGLRSAGMAVGVTVVPIKVLDTNGSGPYSTVADGIRWAVDHGVQIIGMSLGGPSDDPDLRSACSYAAQHNVMIVCSAGNNYGGGVSYPAKYGTVIAVSATGPTNQIAYYSSIGREVDLCAPGGDDRFDSNGDGNKDYVWQEDFQKPNWCTWLTAGYEGTSMASPHVTAAAAMVWQTHPTYTWKDVGKALAKTATDLGAVGRDNTYGFGKINVPAAINYVLTSDEAAGKQIDERGTNAAFFPITSLAVAPSPSRGDVAISFALAQAASGSLEIYRADGRLARTIVSGRFEGGPHTARWDGRDASSRAVPFGLYFVRLTTADDVQTARVVLQP